MNVSSYNLNKHGMEDVCLPFTGDRQFEAAPRMADAVKGMYFEDINGRAVLDGAAGLWGVNAGHGRERIADAINRQLNQLDFAPKTQMEHPITFEFARRLGAIAPAGLDRVVFTGSGSEAVETAVKIAIAYKRAIGQGTRTRVIGRERGHAGFGGLSVGGIVNDRGVYPRLPDADHLRHTHDLDRNAFSKGQPENGVELAEDLERLVAVHGAETIAAVIVEPVAGSTGVLVPPLGYLERLESIARRHGILLIFDEVITGFGRLGTTFAAEYFGIKPDLVCTAKGLTNGALRMGAVFADRKIYDALIIGPERAGELFHKYSYSGHSVGCAAGLATLDIHQEEGLLHRAERLTADWQAAIHSLRDLPHVIDIRAIGLMAGIELQPREEDVMGTRAYDVFVRAFDKAVKIGVTGETIALSPPLIIETCQIDQIVSTLRDALLEIH